MPSAKPATPGADNEVYSFTYRARNSDGKVVTGTAKAASHVDVIRELDRQGLVPLGRPRGGPGTGTAEVQVRKRAKHRSLVITTRMLATMAGAGLSPLESLDIAIRDCKDLPLRNALVEVRLQVQNGSSMSEAMASQPVFPPLVANLLAAGEHSGNIKEALNRVADQYDAEDKLRSKMKKAMMYPIIVAGATVLVLGFMMLYLVPQFSATFMEIGGPDAKLPLITRIVITASDILKYAAPITAVIAVPGYLAYRANRHKEKVREVVDPLKLKIPVMGRLFHLIALARFTRNLSGMLGAGIQTLEALEITSGTIGNIQMERAVLVARDGHRNGEPLVGPLRAEPLFDDMVVSMVESGERSGKTAKMLANAAEVYERDVDQMTDNMATLINPIVMMFLVPVIGVILMAIYLPYWGIGDLL